jgi:hypothetical protein
MLTVENVLVNGTQVNFVVQGNIRLVEDKFELLKESGLGLSLFVLKLLLFFLTLFLREVALGVVALGC